MTTSQTERHSEHVGELYDRLGEFVAAVMGGSLHYGYWPAGAGAADSADSADVRDDSMAAASRRMTALMIGKLGARPGQRVLDVGCGNGTPAVHLAQALDVEVVGVNVAARQIAQATALAAAEGVAGRVRFVLADAQTMPGESGSFDAAWLFESLLHMPDHEAVLRRVAELLKPGGRLVISNLVQLGRLSEAEVAELQPLYQSFGISDVLPLADYPALLAKAGFGVEEIVDITEESVQRTMQTILESAGALRARMSRELDAMPDSEDRFASLAPGQSTELALVSRLAQASDIGYAIVVAAKTGEVAPDAG